MSSAREFYLTFGASDGRIKLAVLIGVSSVVAALALLIGVFPAIAGAGGPSAAGVPPIEVGYGGGSGACEVDFPDQGLEKSLATHELHINNPEDGVFTGPDGTEFGINVRRGDTVFDFWFVGNPDGFPRVVFDVVVNGGAHNTYWDYDGTFPPGLPSDENLHAPTKRDNGGPIFKLSHINICYDVKPIVDLGVTKTLVAVNGGDPTSTVNAEDTLEFRIDVTNEGTADATGVVVTDILPPELAFESSDPAPDPNPPAGQTVAWTIDVPAGKTETIDLFVNVNRVLTDTPGVSNTVSVSHEGDENSDNDDATTVPPITVTKPEADVSVTKTALVDGEPVSESFVVNVGDTVQFKLEVKNSVDSTIPAYITVVTDDLPSTMEYAGSNPAPDDANDDPLEWTFGSIPIGDSEVIILDVTITDAAAGQEDVTNTVSVTSDEFDPNEDNNETSDNSDVSHPPIIVTANVSGVKYHDRDTDGSADSSFENGLPGFTITAFDGDVGTDATTGLDGSYTIANLVPGDYTVCEMAPIQAGLPVGHPSKLPEDDPPTGENDGGYTWSWAQSQPSNTLCVGYDGYLAAGYAITEEDFDAIADDEENNGIVAIDFGNHRQLSVTCDLDEPVIISLGDPVDADSGDDPLATATFPAGCTSEGYTSSFEVGRNDPLNTDEVDDYTQHFVWSGDVDEQSVNVDLLMEWDAEPAVFDTDGNLTVPPTLVELFFGGGIGPAVRCSSATGLPNPTTPYCLESRVITDYNHDGVDLIQVTDYGVALGDPRGFR